MSFPAEMIRTTTNIAEQGLKEMRHVPAAGEKIIGSTVTPYVNIEGKGLVKNNNPMYGTGFKRLSGMATTLVVVPQVVVEGAKAVYDVTEDEIQRYVNSYQSGLKTLRLYLSEQTMVNYVI